MGRRNLPDMYVQARAYTAPEVECRHIRQILTAHVTYTYVMQHSKKFKILPYTSTASLYNNGCCLWLWAFNCNTSMKLIKIHSAMQ